jgi:hypothetical protein
MLLPRNHRHIHLRHFLAVAALLWSALAPDACAQMLTGAQAQKSPLADVALAYERALIFEGIDAASKYMTPRRLEDMRGMIKQYGEGGFKDFQATMKNAPSGEARRKQFESLEIKGDRALLSARSGPNATDEIPLRRMPDGWKIAARDE